MEPTTTLLPHMLIGHCYVFGLILKPSSLKKFFKGEVTPWPILAPSCIQPKANQRKRKRSDSVLWQKPLHQQKCQKGKVTTQTMPQKSSITQRLRTNLGRSVEVITATQTGVVNLVYRPNLPSLCNSLVIKRTHV